MDERRQRRRYALVAGVLGLPGALCGGAAASFGLLLMGLVQWEPAPLGAGVMILLFGPAVMLPALMLVSRRPQQ